MITPVIVIPSTPAIVTGIDPLTAPSGVGLPFGGRQDSGNELARNDHGMHLP